jgi:hypothetical protein
MMARASHGLNFSSPDRLISVACLRRSTAPCGSPVVGSGKEWQMRTTLTSAALALALFVVGVSWAHATDPSSSAGSTSAGASGGAGTSGGSGAAGTGSGASTAGSNDQGGTTGTMTTTPADKSDDATGTGGATMGEGCQPGVPPAPGQKCP